MKIVIITSRFPFPIEKGDKLRAYHHIRGLAQENEVHLISISHLPVSQNDIVELKKFCKSIHVFEIRKLKLLFNLAFSSLEGLPIQVGYFLDRRLKSQIQNRILQIEPDHIYSQLIRTAEYVRNLPFQKTLDYMDVFSVGMHQRSKNGNWIMRPFYHYEAKLLARYEKSVYRDFDHHSIISEQDRNRLQLHYTENIHILPNGVDIDFFQTNEKSKKYDIVFVGNMGYLPNIEAAEYLVKKILPKCVNIGLQLKVLIAGARPDIRVRNLASDQVEISGWVEDIREAYDQSKVFVAPIFTGMGQQNKILEAMAMQLPCITSTMVNNAIGAEDKAHLFLADQPKDFVDIIAHLINNENKRIQTGLDARLFIEKNYSWEKHLETLNQIITKKSFISSAQGRD